MTIRKPHFKSSVNIKFDLGKTEVIDRYLPTPAHAESLIGLLKGFNNKDQNHSHIIIGPYGTGKSLLGTIVSGIVSQNVNKKTLNLLKKKFNKVDDEIYDELNKIDSLEKKYLPIILNGNEGRFRQAILSAILRVLDQNNINIVVPGVVNKVLSTIDTWNQVYPRTYKQFKKLLGERNTDIQVWRLEVLNHNKLELEWFSNIFPLLTSGADFVTDYSEDFIGQMKVVIDELKKLNIGIFVAYDEFGRFLQNLEANEIHETMQDLQDLAELSDHYTDDLHLLLITHKNLSQYFSRLSREYKNEFQRIEKRFKIYHIDSDKSTFIRLTESILGDIKSENKETKEDESVLNNLRKYPLFPELNQAEIEKIIVQGVYPIHPVTLFMLPFLSNIFGQNERTLFTFLESDDKGGLLKFISNNGGYYLPDNLLDYFFPDLNIEIEDSFNDLKVYKRLFSKIPNLNTPEDSDKLEILKLITLWGLAGLHSKFKLTTEFLAFSLHKTNEEIVKSLTYLTKNKAIRYNRVLGYWELFEGSGLNIDELIEEKKDSILVSRKKRLSILEAHLTKKFYLANEYNDEKSMTRFAAVNLVLSSDILNNTYNSVNVRNEKNADAIVNFIIMESSEQYEDLKHAILNNSDTHSIYCLSTYTFDYIEQQVIDYQIIDNILQDPELLKQDKDLKNELIIRKEDISYIIKDFMSVFTKFDVNLYWTINSIPYSITNEIVLEQRLSDLMYKLYPYTPEVRNDSYNRRKINNVQLKAGQSVVDHILRHHTKSKLDIDGNGPDYLIYATIFKNNDLDLLKLEDIKNDYFRLIRQQLNDHLQQHRSGKLIDLVAILNEKPFGIREPLIPILLVSLLRDKWDKLMFYRNEMFIASISGETLFKMVEEANEYEYLFFEFDDQYDTFFDILECEFNSLVSIDDINKPKPIRITNAMLKWLRSLPRLTQMSEQMGSNSIKLKEYIRQAEVDPKNTIEKLFNQYSANLEQLRSNIKEITCFFNRQVEELEKKIYETLGTSSFKDSSAWAQEQNSDYKKENKLVRSLINIQYEDNWINELAFNLVGVEIYNWSDTTSEMFELQLKNEYNKVQNNEVTLGDYVQFSIGGVSKSVRKTELSTKSQTIYKNVHRIINNGGRNVPKEEIELLIIKLLEDFVE